MPHYLEVGPLWANVMLRAEVVIMGASGGAEAPRILSEFRSSISQAATVNSVLERRGIAPARSLGLSTSLSRSIASRYFRPLPASPGAAPVLFPFALPISRHSFCSTTVTTARTRKTLSTRKRRQPSTNNDSKPPPRSYPPKPSLLLITIWIQTFGPRSRQKHFCVTICNEHQGANEFAQFAQSHC